MSDSPNPDPNLDASLKAIVDFLGREVRRPAEKLASDLLQRPADPEQSLVEQALRSARTLGQLAEQLAPREVVETVGQIGGLADELRRQGIDPALGLADLVGDCLDGLDVLISTSAIPLPVEVREARLALARLRRPELRLDLALPAESATPRLAARLVRSLVEGSGDLHEQPRDLDFLDRSIAEAVGGAVERTRRHDPRKPVEIRVRLQGDLLTLAIVDQGPGKLTGDVSGPTPPAWDASLVRRTMDEVSYEPMEKGGTLHLRRSLRSWRPRPVAR